MFVSHRLDQNSRIITFKAPRGTVFEITDIHTAVTAAGNNELIFVDRHVEDEDGDNILSTISEKFFLNIPTDITNAFDANFTIPIRTKWFSVAKVSTQTFAATFVANYRLDVATREELIWEWFGKKR